MAMVKEKVTLTHGRSLVLVVGFHIFGQDSSVNKKRKEKVTFFFSAEGPVTSSDLIRRQI